MIDIDVSLTRGAFSLEARFSSRARVTALFGPSGSGKSTIVGLIAGLVRPDRGHIRIAGETLVDTAARIRLPVWRRRIGLVFQDAQLFPHLSVAENLAYGARYAPRDARGIARATVLETLGIAHLVERRPATLSGGERQRVGIGRALLSQPRILLMDEPLASLDTARKAEILPLIERVAAEFGVPIVYVSHNVEEVVRLADTVVRLEAGRVAVIGGPGEVLAAAGADRFELISVLHAEVAGYDAHYRLTELTHPAGTLRLAGHIEPAGRRVRLAVRATDVTLARPPAPVTTAQTVLEGEIVAVSTDDGPTATVTAALPGGDKLTASVTRQSLERLGFAPGTAVAALIKTVALDERPLG
jgi:molybdate transport system ATP-binding protein